MSTFGIMQERIRDEINRGTTYDTAIKWAIHNAIQHYRSKRFMFNTKKAYTTTSAGVEFYALPTDCREIDMLRITYSSGNYTDRMDEVTYRWIEDHRTNVSYQSEPEKFAVHARELRLWPVPDGSYQILMTYLFEPSGVSVSASDNATNAWMTDGYELIKSRAKADVLENTVRGQEAILEAQINKTREKEAFREMRREVNRRDSSGRLTPTL